MERELFLRQRMGSVQPPKYNLRPVLRIAGIDKIPGQDELALFEGERLVGVILLRFLTELGNIDEHKIPEGLRDRMIKKHPDLASLLQKLPIGEMKRSPGQIIKEEPLALRLPEWEGPSIK